MWVFGYGSLMWDDWQTQHGCIRKVRAILPEFRRIFNKASIRNWGTPDAPGPTLNIIPDASNSCIGFAFEFADESRSIVLAELERREGRNFELRASRVLIDRQSFVDAYVPYYTGSNVIHDKSLAQIAKMAQSASGTSGKCIDYVTNIAAKLSELGIDDPVIREFSEAVNHRL